MRKLRKFRLVCFELLRLLKQNFRVKKLQNDLVEVKVNFYVKSIEQRYFFKEKGRHCYFASAPKNKVVVKTCLFYLSKQNVSFAIRWCFKLELTRVKS